MQMASRLVNKFLLRPILGIKAPFKVSVVAKCKFYSTQSHLEVDVKKLTADNGPSPWKLCAAVCLVRLPIVEEAMTDLERSYLNMKDEIEYENSVYNSWELEDQKQQQLIKDIEAGMKNPEDIDFKETNRDLEDSYEASLNEFKESSNEITVNNEDIKDVNRRPRDTLVFITKEQLGSDMVWTLPRVECKEYETMKDSASRALETCCGEDTGALFTSNAPSGFYKYKFPKVARDSDGVGAKLFIYNAFLPRNSVTNATYRFEAKPDESVLDHAWIARDEMRAYMKPKYIAAIDRIILKWS